MQFLEGGFRIKILEQIRMQPLGNLLNRDKLIGIVVELVPDGVDIAVLDGFDAGKGRALRQVFKLAERFLRIGSRSRRRPNCRREHSPASCRR